jgi:hypothetical protein
MLNPQPEPPGITQPLAVAASAAQSAADAVLPQSVRDLPSNVVDTVTEFLGQATGVVSGLVDAVTERAAEAGEQTETQVDYAPAAPQAATKRPRAASTSKKGAAKSSAKRASAPRSKKSAGEGPSGA